MFTCFSPSWRPVRQVFFIAAKFSFIQCLREDRGSRCLISLIQNVVQLADVRAETYWISPHPESKLPPECNNDLTVSWQAVISLPKWVYFRCNKDAEMKRAADRRRRRALPTGATISSARCVSTPLRWASRGLANASCPFSNKVALLHQREKYPVFDSPPVQQSIWPPSKVKNKTFVQLVPIAPCRKFETHLVSYRKKNSPELTKHSEL